ncbi:ABC transporter substrate-binding protein [Actinopolymorpha alba]|uniref:ABC transporter substrate-binding protein n=1 Tax=Actinopolymorpha alba TaxID=533267 RepID=UPI0003705F4D|nr:extracellular solute-binding protein [Actinopolymorpha alba]
MGSPSISLRGICWDHPRCTHPMAAAAAVWQSARPDVEVVWDVRALSAFNDQPLETISGQYDLLIFDHPMVGAAARTRCLAPLDELLPGEALAAAAAGTVGRSHQSYAYAGHQWGLALDAACQVSVVRDDLLVRHGVPMPSTWDDVLRLAGERPGLVAMPLDPADAICCLLTMSASLGTPLQALDGGFSGEAVELLYELARVVDPSSYDLNPPALLDRMRAGDEIGYVPLSFGYTTYSRPTLEGGAWLRFADIPVAVPGGEPHGSILGGAGIAVSASSVHRAEAAEFACWVASPAAQRYVGLAHDGQPAASATWSDPAADAVVGGFFSGTRATMDAAWTRPRDPWWRAFQEAAGRQLAAGLQEGRRPGEILRGLDHLLDQHRPAGRT